MLVRKLIPLLLLSQFCFAQNELRDVSDSRTKIAGTKYSLIAPPGYTKAAGFSGFQNTGTGGSILLLEIPGPFDTVKNALTPERLKAAGMEFISSESVVVNKDSGILIKVKQPGNGIVYNKMILVFGNEEKTVMVNSITPENSNEEEPGLREALFSISYHNNQDENIIDAAPFTADTESSGMKPVRYMAGTLFYSADGKMPTKTPTLLIGSSLGASTIADAKTYAEQRLKKLPRGEFNVIRKTSAVTVDGLKGYEIIAFGKSEDNKPELVYMTMLFNPGSGYFIIVGNSEQDFAGYEEKFRKVALSFKRKP
jgi:hypothetical protein